jgi:thiosulfate/3-mercaptopyruvate sulfurtransferase
MDDLVSTDWLAQNLGQADVVVVDASWHMPSTNRNGREEYLASHIPGARFLDIDAVADMTNPAPHMLPSAEEFGPAMEALGIGRNDRIVVYDNSSTRNASRGWFMFRHFGADQVAILDGGFPKWIAEGRPSETGEPLLAPPVSMRWSAQAKSSARAMSRKASECRWSTLEAEAVSKAPSLILDPNVAAGHIPGARNLPFSDLYNPDGTFKSRDEIRQLFNAARVDPEKPFVASCGSGVTANSLIFAARLLGNRDTRLYDGSWSEWGADPATPKERGPA